MDDVDLMKQRVSFLRRRWIDFRSGHAEFLVLVIWGWTTILISYRLFIEMVVDIPLWLMVIMFPAVYIPLGSVVGYVYRRKLMSTQMSLMFSQYPEMKKMQEDIAWIKERLERE